MNKTTCKDCQYYFQHYSLCDGKLYRVFCGRCIFGRVRTKRPFNKVCENFVSGPKDADAFISKEYLSKKLLEHVLNMELLPENIKELSDTGR